MNDDHRKKAFEQAKEGKSLAHGDSRSPVFGEPIRGIWASSDNPIRDGFYVETVRRTGRLNPGVWYKLTDKHGKFWSFLASETVFLNQ